MIKVFKERGLPPPIIYLHNHDFNGLGGHIGAEVRFSRHRSTVRALNKLGLINKQKSSRSDGE